MKKKGNFIFYTLTMISFLLIILNSCKKEQIPILTTLDVSSITQNSVSCGGNITSDGGGTITVRGVCWSTTQRPTISDSKTSDGFGLGNFTSNINGLLSNTTYYVRAYATNNTGTSYGTVISFVTAPSMTPWLLSGLDGKWVNSIAISGTKIFAGTYEFGVFLSEDNGLSWTAVNIGLSNSNVNSLVLADNKIFAGTESGIFVTTNDGTNWTQVNANLPSSFHSVNCFAVDGNKIFTGGTFGVYRSDDFGVNWSPMNTGLPTPGIWEGVIYSLAVCGSYVFAGENNTCYRSDINGSSWTTVGGSNDVHAFAVSGNKIFAGCNLGYWVGVSDNYGLSWTSVSNKPGSSTWSFVVAGEDLIQGASNGVYLTKDNGTIWNNVSTGLSGSIISLAICDSTIYAGGYGIWKNSLASVVGN